MDKILFVNSCVRENSRTLELAKCVLENTQGEIKEVDLEAEKILPLTKESLEKREWLVKKRDLSDDMFMYAKDFANSDVIVIAAPYWDLSFPALLKIYFEQIAVNGITFRYDSGKPMSLCKVKKIIYVTTSGGPIILNLGFEYVKAFVENFCGISDIMFFSAEMLDVEGVNVKGNLDKAKDEIKYKLKKDNERYI